MENYHRISNFKLYPTYHRWLVNQNKLNLYANVEVKVGDILDLFGTKLTVKEIEFQAEEITTEVLSEYILPTTNFYTLIIEEIKL